MSHNYESDPADDLLRHHPDSVRAETLAGLSDSDMSRLAEFARGMLDARGGCRIVGRILEAIWCRESHRRGSGGRVELRSYELPNLMPGELYHAFTAATCLTYSAHSETLCRLFDEIAGQLSNQIGVYLLQLQGTIEAQASL